MTDFGHIKSLADLVDKENGDPIDHPPHYVEGRQYEPIDVIEDWGLGFSLGNAVKYIARAYRKGEPLTDLRKAAWYLNRVIAQLEHQA